MVSYPASLWGWLPSDKAVKFRDQRLNRSGDIRPVAIGGGIFDRFFRNNFRPEVASDVISGVVVDQMSVYVRVKFGDSSFSQSDWLNLESLNSPSSIAKWEYPDSGDPHSATEDEWRRTTTDAVMT